VHYYYGYNHGVVFVFTSFGVFLVCVGEEISMKDSSDEYGIVHNSSYTSFSGGIIHLFEANIWKEVLNNSLKFCK